MMLAFMTAMLCDCAKEASPDGGFMPFYDHSLLLSFRDISGNDLVKGIGYDPENKKPGETVLWKYGTDEYMIVKSEDLGGIVQPDLYTLEYIFPDGIPNPWKPPPGIIIFGFMAVGSNENVPQLSLQTGLSFFPTATSAVNMDYDYLYFSNGSYRAGYLIRDCEFPEKIIIRFTCPYLFGDNEAHDIVTWWKKDATGSLRAECYRIEFEGKEFTDITLTPLHQISTIILDR